MWWCLRLSKQPRGCFLVVHDCVCCSALYQRVLDLEPALFFVPEGVTSAVEKARHLIKSETRSILVSALT